MKPLRAGWLLALTSLVAAGWGADDGRWAVAVAPFAFDGTGHDYGRRFGERVARGVERANESFQVLAPKKVSERLAGLPAEAAGAARECLAGGVDARTAPVTAALVGAHWLVLGGVSADGEAAAAELWDLRQPRLVARSAATGGSSGELLPRADRVGAVLAEAVTLEARLVPRGGRYVSGDQFELDLGHRHGLRGQDRLWLLADLTRDEVGGWAGVVGLGRLLTVSTRTSRGIVDAIWPGAEIASARFAVPIREHGGYWGGWLDPWLVGVVGPSPVGRPGPCLETWWNPAGELLGGQILYVRPPADGWLVVRSPAGAETRRYLVGGVANPIRVLPGSAAPQVTDLSGEVLTIVPFRFGPRLPQQGLLTWTGPLDLLAGTPFRVALSAPFGWYAELLHEPPGGPVRALTVSAGGGSLERYVGLAPPPAGEHKLKVRAYGPTGGYESVIRFLVRPPAM